MAKLIRLSTRMTDAILTVLRYVKATTGKEPTQTEVAEALKSYFILNEIDNQIKFQRKKKLSQHTPETSLKEPSWKINLKTGPPENSFVRVGVFHKDIKEALIAVQRFVKDAGADEPNEVEIALSLKSSFILSEIKSQIEWQRNSQKKSKKTISLTK